MQRLRDTAHPEVCCLHNAALHVLRLSCYCDTTVSGCVNLQLPCQHKPGYFMHCPCSAACPCADLADTGSAKHHLLQAEALLLSVRRILLHCPAAL